MCNPGAVALDPYGNLFVSDHALEVEGNHRLLEYDATLFQDAPVTALFGISATRVFGTGGSFTGPCVPPLCGPWEPAFDSTGRMVVGFNAYIGSRFPVLYEHPLTDSLTYTFTKDFHSMAYGATFDSDDNLYITDLNRSRVLIYCKKSQLSDFDTDFDTDADTDHDSDADFDSDRDANRDPDFDSDADGDANTHTDRDPDFDGDVNTEQNLPSLDYQGSI